MQKACKLSRYTQVIRDNDSGDLLLHNSFMGAIARIPARQSASIATLLRQRSAVDDVHGPSQYRLKNIDGLRPPGLPEAELSDAEFQDLYEGGFLVPVDLDENKIVSDVISQENESEFGIIILPHENCNFRCVYCYETFARGKMKQDVMRGLKSFVARKVKDVPSLAVSWFGGEPLLARDVIYELSDSFLASCAQYDVPYSGSMTTNGYFLSPEVVDALLTRQVTHYQVTLDGPEQAHDSTRKLAGGGGTFRRILDNLTQMHKRDDVFRIRLRVNFNNASFRVMEDFFSEVAPVFKDDARFTLDFHPVGRWGGPNDSVLDVCDAESATVVKTSLIKRALNLGFSDTMVKQPLMSHSNVCYAGRENSMVVGSDGTLYKCTVAFEDPRNHVGKMTTEGELVIDQSRWDLWTRLDDKNTHKCTSCSFHPSCQSRSCPLAAINEKEPPCPMTQTEYESMVKMVALTVGPAVPDSAHQSGTLIPILATEEAYE